MPAPTRALGIVDDSAVFSQWAGVYGDIFENVPDLFHPTSVQTYALMRRDPQLKAVLSALTLPVRRATWQVNGAGCRPEVVQVVADDLGLPVCGEAREPTGARVRGVKWRDHLRKALLREVFGYMPFAHGYQIRDGLARLVVLAERMPQTWYEVKTDSDGNLEWAQQRTDAGQTTTPKIPASSLTWHVREREGSNWWGTSALRECYAAWLIKREMQRVLATSNRRFGMGVPNMRALPGTNPTPQQMDQAQQAMSAVRVGDQGGMATPPGFTAELLGISGSTPDTLAFIRFLNQEMSRTALAGFLDLGDTPNGSRALGESWVDLFLLVEQTLADDIAATETEQTVARLVGWNWGDDEPVPMVEVADVGSKREVTVEALQTLISALPDLAADPAISEWVRREWRLPLRTAPVPAPGPAVESSPAAGPPPAPVYASAPRPRKVAAAGQRRQLTLVEAAAGTDFDAIERDWQKALAALLETWAAVTAAQREQLLTQISAAASVAAVARLDVDSGAAAALLSGRMRAVAAASATRMRAEAKAQGVPVPKVVPDAARLDAMAATYAALAGRGLAQSAARKAIQVWTGATTPTAVAAAVGDHLESLTDAGLADVLGGAVSAAQNEGRLAVLRNAPKATYVASEIHDKAACQPCLDIDGTEFESLAAAEGAYANGAFVGCEGGLRCRGLPMAVWSPEEAVS